jgi:hypothetical protein
MVLNLIGLCVDELATNEGIIVHTYILTKLFIVTKLFNAI